MDHFVMVKYKWNEKWNCMVKLFKWVLNDLWNCIWMCKDLKVDCLNCIEYSMLIMNEIELCNECYWMKELKDSMAFVWKVIELWSYEVVWKSHGWILVMNECHEMLEAEIKMRKVKVRN